MLLANAGLEVVAEPAEFDERAARAPLHEEGLGADDIAAVLAEAKAGTVSETRPGALVIGADQTLSCDGERFDKPRSMEEAREQLLRLRGRTHMLHSAVACVRDGETLFRHLDEARLTMRDVTPAFVGRYLARIGNKAFESVGAYQIEGPGIQLFARIEGDFFTILGLPLLPLLAFLRAQGILET
jgi:septum formation protein